MASEKAGSPGSPSLPPHWAGTARCLLLICTRAAYLACLEMGPGAGWRGDSSFEPVGEAQNRRLPVPPGFRPWFLS